jgi:hypothetical protein
MSFLKNFAATAARQTLNSTWLLPYGTLTELEIDAKNHTLALALELKGETQPIQIRIKHYELVERENETFLELGEIETSREWVNTLLREHLLDKVIKPKLRQTPLPGMVHMLL